MQTIADEAGVNKGTVSRALRNHPSLPMETCRRIQGIAERLGYKTNPYVSALMHSIRENRSLNTTSPMAYLSFVSREEHSEFFYRYRFLEGAKARAEQLGYRIDVFWLNEADEPKDPASLSRILFTRSIPGLIVGPTPGPFTMPGFEWDRFAPASVSYHLTEPRLHRAENDQLRCMQLIFANLQRTRYKRVGLLLNTMPVSPIGDLYKMSYYLNEKENRHFEYTEPIMSFDYTPEDAVAWFREQKPEVVVTNDTLVYNYLTQAGHRCPEEFGFVLLDVPLEQQEVSGVIQNYEGTAAAAVNLVDAQLRRNERGVPEAASLITIEGSWNRGKTLRYD